MTKPKMERAPRFWKFAAAWALLIFLLSSIPGGSFPQAKIFSYDKILHASVYGVLGILCFLASARTWSLRTAVLVLLSAAMTTLYGFTDEFHQLFVPGRSADLYDVLADAVGGLAGALAASFLPMATVSTGPKARADGVPAKSNRAS
jgi:VanZ family protein